VAHADLSQLDAGVVGLDEVLDQFPKIDTARGGKIKNDLAAIVEHFHVHELHIEVSGVDALAAVDPGLPGKGEVFTTNFVIFVAGETEDGFEVLPGDTGRGLVTNQGHAAHAEPLFGLDEDVFPRRHHERSRIEKVNGPVVVELDTENMAHECPMLHAAAWRR